MRRFLALAAALPGYGAMNRKKALVFAILTLLLLCFIWGQSMLPQEQSSNESSRLMRIIKPALDPNDRIDDGVFHHYLRKTAHFAEYAAMGLCMSGFLMNLNWKRKSFRIPAVILICILVASIDECIQLFAADRGPQVRDVILDSCGAAFGLAVYLLVSRLVHLCRKGKT